MTFFSHLELFFYLLYRYIKARFDGDAAGVFYQPTVHNEQLYSHVNRVLGAILEYQFTAKLLMSK